MLNIVWEKKFKKDFTILLKRKKNIEKLGLIISDLQCARPLQSKNRNHKLKGNYVNYWECHIEPDWLLIYKLTDTELILVRTGSHSDLF